MKLDLFDYHIQKNGCKTYLTEPIILLKLKTVEKFYHIDLSNDFLGMIPKLQTIETKMDKLGNIKLNTFSTAKETINQRDQPTE